MKEQLQSDFNKIIESSKISKIDVELKRNFLNKFIENGFPNKKIEDWKFLDISQIIKKNISDLSFFNDYSQSNKIDTSIFHFGIEKCSNTNYTPPAPPLFSSSLDKRNFELISPALSPASFHVKARSYN